MTIIRWSLTCCLLMSVYSSLWAQNGVITATQFLENNRAQFGADSRTEWLVTDATESPNGMRNIYFTQSKDGILVENSMVNIHLTPDDEVIYSAGGFIGDLQTSITNAESINVYQALRVAFEDLDWTYLPAEVETIIGGASKAINLTYSDLAWIPIDAKLIYVPIDESEVKLTWAIDIYLEDGSHYWQFRVDAATATILQKRDAVISCTFDHPSPSCQHKHHFHLRAETPQLSITPIAAPTAALMTPQYRVYPVGIESPNHGARELVDEPADVVASPFGWHDTNGVAGAEYTITRGNNVLAQADENANNGSGYRPDAGSSLIFDYPIDFGMQPAANRDASLTNLFFWNNIMHDLAYNYGLTESTGNFQENNYGRGGAADDYVFADGLDGSGRNNATMGTPSDGGNPRMTMFLWDGQSTLEVNSPSTIGDAFNMRPGGFGASDYTLTGDVVLVDDGSLGNDGDGTINDGCETPFTNAAALSGKIAMIDRGNCQFSLKALHAQNAGATGVIICNNVPGNSVLTMAGGDNGGSITIPAIMVGFDDCVTLKSALPGLNVTFSDETIDIDGSFDNGIIAHEYGHGISNRLTGGPGAAGCLSNTEQMGEGWSDFMGLITTVQPGDTGAKRRGIGTFATIEPTDGVGIRNFPYSTDTSINPVTYDDIKTFSVPHGVGSVWCSMIWDLYWELVAVHGFDDDLYNGTGGNNIAIDLVFHGMKMQSCSPGFIDGRDAILAADQSLYGGANKCTIWKAFARRGLGFSASQGSSNSRSDGTEAYDLPTDCECEVGVACDDGDPCTIDDVFVQNGNSCDCVGTLADSDGDGVCDADDVCPGFDDNVDNNNNGTPDGCDADCQMTIAFVNEIVSGGTYKSATTITTSGTVSVANGATVIMGAAQSVILSPGFSAPSGTTLTIRVNDVICPPAANEIDIRSEVAGEIQVTDIHPNPTGDWAQFEFFLPNEATVQIRVMNLNGQVVNQFPVQSTVAGWHRVQLPVGELTNGIYLLQFQTGATMRTAKFVVQQ
ncbi:MAG: M36 family metallopeptidase [Bacteroidota bacterium]